MDQPPIEGGSAADPKRGPRPGIRGEAGKGNTRTPPARRERDHRGSRRGTWRGTKVDGGQSQRPQRTQRGARAWPAQDWMDDEGETTEAHGGGHGGARRWMEDNHNGHKGLKGGRGRGPRRTGWTTRRNRRLRRLRQIWGSATADRTARGEDHGGHEGGWRTITADTKDTKEGADSRGLWRVAGGEGFCYTISPVLRQVAVIVWEGRRPCSVRTSRRCSSSVRGPL